MSIGICKSCSQEFKFFGSQASGQFCSRECSHDYRTRLIMESGQGKKGNALTYLKRFVKYACSACGLSDWQGQKISLQIDHIDGDKHNNTIDNIRWLCPNCHSQTHNWGFRNATEHGKLASREGGRKGKLSQKVNRSSYSTEELERLAKK